MRSRVGLRLLLNRQWWLRSNPKPETVPATNRRPLSEIARHVVVPEGIVASEWPSARKTCRHLRWGFDGWQCGASMLIRSMRADGEYAADTIVISIPRQVGKSYLIGCIIFADGAHRNSPVMLI